MLSPQKTPLTSTFFSIFELRPYFVPYVQYSSAHFCPFFGPLACFLPLILSLIILVCVLLLLGGHGIYMYQPPPVGWYPPKNIFSQTLVLSSVFSLHLRFRSVERSSLYTLLFVTTLPPLFCVSYLTWTY